MQFTFLRRVHHFLARHLFYPLALSTLLAVALFFGRAVRDPDWHYRFMLWNLFLAWIPYGLGLLLASLHGRFPRQWWLLAIPFGFWLIFFPNAPYLITDLLHLDERPPVPLWYDIGLFVTFAWTGCFLGVVSLNTMQALVRSYLGRWASWLFVASMVTLSALGIYLGRFLDWNSWDLFIHPRTIVADVLARVLHPISNPQIYGFTLMFAAFLLVCYLTFISVQQRERR
jgi:uncharacterized membrane protein